MKVTTFFSPENKENKQCMAQRLFQTFKVFILPLTVQHILFKYNVLQYIVGYLNMSAAIMT